MNKRIEFKVNGKKIIDDVNTNKMLLDYLRENLGLIGTKNGCGTGHCGTCTVIIDGEAKRSCIIKMGRCENKKIETIENLTKHNKLHPIQQAFIDEGAIQCGFCTPGMIMASKALLDKKLNPTDEEIRHALRFNICRCTGYGAIIRAVKKASKIMQGKINAKEKKDDFVAVGKNVPRKDAFSKVTGARLFADDYHEKGNLYGKILFSEYAHARIEEIDIKKAEALEGVIKVATYKDIPGLNKFGLMVPQQPVLCKDEVKYFGDAVACVYATSESVARKALSLIKVVYKPLKVLLDAEENMRETSELLHKDTDNNIVHSTSVRRGNLDEGFQKADYIVENIYETQAVEHAYLEPEACLVKPMGSGVHLFSGNQGSLAYKKMIMTSLSLKEDEVRVTYTPTGGSFGGKEEPTIQILAALGVLLTKKPVKMILSREESIRMSVKRHPMKIWMKHGVTNKGEIVAMKVRTIADAGAYISQTMPVVFRSAVTSSGPYEVGNVEVDSYGIYTHNNPSGAFRGFGSTQVCFACESQIDQLAHGIGMSPYELRLKNAFKENVATSTGQVLKDGIGYVDTLRAVNKKLEEKKQFYINKEREEHVKLGFGIASSYKNVGIGNGTQDNAGAFVEVTSSGRILVSIGATDLGQGVDTIAAQICATELQVPYDLVDVISSDTALCPDGGMTTGSRQTYVTGNAVKEASGILKRKILDLLKQDTPLSQEVLSKIYNQAKESNKNLKVEYMYFPPKTYPHRVDSNHKPGEDISTYDIHYAYCFASVSVALEVNTLTGEVNLLDIWSAQDVGKVIHPTNLVGQIEGSVAMGIGYALSEEYVADNKKIFTDTLKKLKIPSIKDIPPVESIIIEEKQISGPYGAKGMGVVGMNPVAPAIANAIYDAIGIRFNSLPIKPEKILEKLNRHIISE